MTVRTFTSAALLMACTSSKPGGETIESGGSETDTPSSPTDSGGSSSIDSGDDGTPDPEPPSEPIEVDCTAKQGAAKVSGIIEGTPTRMVSAAWYADERGTAWIILSPTNNACSDIDAFKSNSHDHRAMSIWISDFSVGHTAPIQVVRETDLEAGDGNPDAVVNGWEPIINLAVMMQYGVMTVHSAERGGTIAITGLDSWSEYADIVEGDFTACWCPEAEKFEWPMVEDSSPPAPPPLAP